MEREVIERESELWLQIKGGRKEWEENRARVWVINPCDSFPVSCATGYKSQTTSLTFDKVTSYSES